MEKKIKILHAPTLVGGNPPRLSDAEKELGLNSFCVTACYTKYAYHYDLSIYHKNYFIRWVKLLYWAFFKSLFFDVVHFNFGQSFLPERIYTGRTGIKEEIKLFIKSKLELLDVKFLSLVGKKIFVTYQGDDARQGEFCKKNYQIHFVNYVDDNYFNKTTDHWKAERIKVFEKYSQGIFAVNPDLLNVLPSKAKFVPYCGVDLNYWSYVGTQKGNDFIPKVIHAPSHREVKGTHFIIDAVARLKAEGIQFEFELIENMTNEEARKIYESADLLIDQLLAGYYGGLSMELMALGKPVICYLRQEDFKYMPPEMVKENPIINTTPDDIYVTLKTMITNRKFELRELGEQSRRFVEKWHNPQTIAKEMMYYYLGTKK